MLFQFWNSIKNKKLLLKLINKILSFNIVSLIKLTNIKNEIYVYIYVTYIYFFILLLCLLIILIIIHVFH